MTTGARTEESTRRRPLRLLPGVVIVVLQWLAVFGLPIVAPEVGAVGVLGGLAGGLAVVVWWAFFSRAPGLERWSALPLMVLALLATRSITHASIAKGGMGLLFFIYAVPVLSLAFVVWAVACRGLPDRPRRWAMVATILLSCGAWALVRTAGVTGSGDWDFEWRWAETPEDRLLARMGDESTQFAAMPAAGDTGVVWPGFRGADRDSVIRGVRLETDWSVAPPVELWRRPIGPGWSSFAIGGDCLYTQEQRGEDELVSCYDAATGEPIWRHRDAARFWEPQAGAGPRATPTLSAGRLYTLGATGILNALDAGDGSVVWTRNAASDTGAEVPGWGFSSSALLVGDLVVVHVGALAAYDRATGALRWTGPEGGSYSSPHGATLDGVPQILMLSGAGATSVAPADGAVLWEHPFPGGIVQPALTADGDVLINGGGMAGGTGLRRIAVARSGGLVANAELSGPGGWSSEERWTSNRLKPNFNDFVVHEGHAYGFDGSILAALDLEDGKRRWKGGRYGNGQLVLLPEQDLLLVLSEKGELALVSATPDQFTELARFPAIEGKTWNHPVLVGDRLFVRNGEEMAAFRLALADG